MPLTALLPFTLLPFTLLPFTLLPFTLLPFTLLPFTLLPFTLLPFTLLPFTLLPFTLLLVQARENGSGPSPAPPPGTGSGPFPAPPPLQAPAAPARPLRGTWPMVIGAFLAILGFAGLFEPDMGEVCLVTLIFGLVLIGLGYRMRTDSQRVAGPSRPQDLAELARRLAYLEARWTTSSGTAGPYGQGPHANETLRRELARLSIRLSELEARVSPDGGSIEPPAEGSAYRPGPVGEGEARYRQRPSESVGAQAQASAAVAGPGTYPMKRARSAPVERPCPGCQTTLRFRAPGRHRCPVCDTVVSWDGEEPQVIEPSPVVLPDWLFSGRQVKAPPVAGPDDEATFSRLMAPPPPLPEPTPGREPTNRPSPLPSPLPGPTPAPAPPDIHTPRPPHSREPPARSYEANQDTWWALERLQGSSWLQRVGVLLILLAVVLLSNTWYVDASAFAKATMVYLVALVFCGLGELIQHNWGPGRKDQPHMVYTGLGLTLGGFAVLGTVSTQLHFGLELVGFATTVALVMVISAVNGLYGLWKDSRIAQAQALVTAHLLLVVILVYSDWVTDAQQFGLVLLVIIFATLALTLAGGHRSIVLTGLALNLPVTFIPPLADPAWQGWGPLVLALGSGLLVWRYHQRDASLPEMELVYQAPRRIPRFFDYLLVLALLTTVWSQAWSMALVGLLFLPLWERARSASYLPLMALGLGLHAANGSSAEAQLLELLLISLTVIVTLRGSSYLLHLGWLTSAAGVALLALAGIPGEPASLGAWVPLAYLLGSAWVLRSHLQLRGELILVGLSPYVMLVRLDTHYLAPYLFLGYCAAFLTVAVYRDRSGGSSSAGPADLDETSGSLYRFIGSLRSACLDLVEGWARWVGRGPVGSQGTAALPWLVPLGLVVAYAGVLVVGASDHLGHFAGELEVYLALGLLLGLVRLLCRHPLSLALAGLAPWVMLAAQGSGSARNALLVLELAGAVMVVLGPYRETATTTTHYRARLAWTEPHELGTTLTLLLAHLALLVVALDTPSGWVAVLVPWLVLTLLYGLVRHHWRDPRQGLVVLLGPWLLWLAELDRDPAGYLFILFTTWQTLLLFHGLSRESGTASASPAWPKRVSNQAAEAQTMGLVSVWAALVVLNWAGGLQTYGGATESWWVLLLLYALTIQFKGLFPPLKLQGVPAMGLPTLAALVALLCVAPLVEGLEGSLLLIISLTLLVLHGLHYLERTGPVVEALSLATLVGLVMAYLVVETLPDTPAHLAGQTLELAARELATLVLNLAAMVLVFFLALATGRERPGRDAGDHRVATHLLLLLPVGLLVDPTLVFAALFVPLVLWLVADRLQGPWSRPLAFLLLTFNLFRVVFAHTSWSLTEVAPLALITGLFQLLFSVHRYQRSPSDPATFNSTIAGLFLALGGIFVAWQTMIFTTFALAFLFLLLFALRVVSGLGHLGVGSILCYVLTMGKLLLMDLWGQTTEVRIVALAIVGGVSLVVHYSFNRWMVVPRAGSAPREQIGSEPGPEP